MIALWLSLVGVAYACGLQVSDWQWRQPTYRAQQAQKLVKAADKAEAKSRTKADQLRARAQALRAPAEEGPTA